MDILVSVTAEDIREGTRSHAILNPVAFALSRAMQRSIYVYETIAIADRDGRRALHLDAFVLRQLNEYNKSGFVRPFHFYVPPLTKWEDTHAAAK